MYRSTTVAAVSLKPAKWDKAGNADKLEAFFTRAAGAEPRPELIVAPEGVLEGYVVHQVLQQPERGEAMLALAEPIDGPYIRRFQQLARRLGTCLCFGFAERIGDEIYGSAVFVDHDGVIRGKHHKMQFGTGTHQSWFCNREGQALRAFDTPLGRVGIVICNDRRSPLLVGTLVLDGARLILIPAYGARTREQNLVVLARARENGVPIVQANVGMNLIVSKGEVVAYKWGTDQVTAAVIDIPEPPSTSAARRAEQEYLDARGPLMARRYQQWLRRTQALDDAASD